MSYPKTGEEVYVSLNLSNTMLTGLGKGTITREDVSVDYLKKLFMQHGVIVSAKPEYRNIMERVNSTYDLGLEIPAKLQLFQLSEQHRRLVVVNISGLQRKNGSLLPSYTEEELDEATFTFVKYYVQGEHYDELVEENKKLRYEPEQESTCRNRTDSAGCVPNPLHTNRKRFPMGTSSFFYYDTLLPKIPRPATRIRFML